LPRGDDSLAAEGESDVTSTIEAQKAAVVRAAQSRVDQDLPDRKTEPGERALLHRFIAELYEHVPPETVGNARKICGAALALWRFAAHRRAAAPNCASIIPSARRMAGRRPYVVDRQRRHAVSSIR
jgi:hypothetical protein